MEANEIRQDPCKIFFIYSRKDKEYLDALLGHLKILEKNGEIELWHDALIDLGEIWEKQVLDHLDASEIVLILVSPDYYMSEYIHKKEIERAAQKHKDGDAVLIPLFIRSCAWKDDALISSLQGMPRDGIALSQYTKNKQDAILSDEIVEGMKDAIAKVKKIRGRKEEERQQELARKKREEEAAKEVTAWEHVLKSNTIPAYKAYLSEFPTGPHAKEAEGHVRRLEYDEQHKKEDQLWSDAVAIRTPEAYQNYLKAYPEGIYTKIAAFRINPTPKLPDHAESSPDVPQKGATRNMFFYIVTGIIAMLSFGLGQYLTNSPSTHLDIKSQWQASKQKGTIYGYQKFIYENPNAPEARLALDSLTKVERRRDILINNGKQHYGNQMHNWARDCFLKAYALDSLNTTARRYLVDSLQYPLGLLKLNSSK